MRTLPALLLITVILIASLILLFHSQTRRPSPPIPSLPTELSLQQYKQIRDALVAIVDKQNPRVALEVLREETASSEAITRSCHDLTHEIGHAAYNKYKDFATAMQYQDEICNSGYLHGIIESHFAKAQDIFATMKTVCSNYPITTFIGWECFHGVGHGLMYYTENDLPKSLSLCDTFGTHPEQEACINGIFMENFNVDQKIHISRYAKPDDPFYPCTSEKSTYKGDCYLYAPTQFLSLHKNQYVQALQLCRSAEKDYQLTCIAGVGSQAIKEHINNPKFVESICMQGSIHETEACITGMVGLYINHFGELKEARQLCSTFKKQNQSTCKEMIATEQSLF